MDFRSKHKTHQLVLIVTGPFCTQSVKAKSLEQRQEWAGSVPPVPVCHYHSKGQHLLRRLPASASACVLQGQGEAAPAPGAELSLWLTSTVGEAIEGISLVAGALEGAGVVGARVVARPLEGALVDVCKGQRGISTSRAAQGALRSQQLQACADSCEISRFSQSTSCNRMKWQFLKECSICQTGFSLASAKTAVTF